MYSSGSKSETQIHVLITLRHEEEYIPPADLCCSVIVHLSVQFEAADLKYWSKEYLCCAACMHINSKTLIYKCQHTASIMSSLLNSEKSQQGTLNVRIFDSFMKCVIFVAWAVACTDKKMHPGLGLLFIIIVMIQSKRSELGPIQGCFVCFGYVSDVKNAPPRSVVTHWNHTALHRP